MSGRGYDRARLLLACCLFAIVVASILSVGDVGALTLKTITIDGDTSDWTSVLADPANVTRDTVRPVDPDNPGQAQRDVRYCAATYDSDYLYLFWRVTASWTQTAYFAAYIDRDYDFRFNGDGKGAAVDDVCITWAISSGQPTANGEIIQYSAADPTNGDDLGGDGQTPLGTAWVQQTGSITPIEAPYGARVPGGLEAEARVPWSALGFSGPQPVNLHFALANGGNKMMPGTSGNVVDNAGPPLDVNHRSISVTPDLSSGGSADTTITYTHTITNSGTSTETVNLTATSSRGWPLLISAIADGPALSSVVLASGESTTVLLSVRIPAGTSEGITDVSVLRGTLLSDSSIWDAATDRTTVGRITVTPSREATMAPGQMVTYYHTVSNYGSEATTLALTAATSGMWTTHVYDSAGATTTAIRLDSNESTTIAVKVWVPSTATTGTVAYTTIRATNESDPLAFGEVVDRTAVQAGLRIFPNNQNWVGPGATVFYAHYVQNSWPDTRTIDLAATAGGAGWSTQLYAADKITPIATIIVGPNGAIEPFWLAVTAAPTTSGTATQTIVASTGGYSDNAYDVTTVRNLAIFDDPSFGHQSDSFVLTQTVWLKGFGLTPSQTYRFVITRADGTTTQTALFTADTDGIITASYILQPHDPVGEWRVDLVSSGGTTLSYGYFTVGYRADITALAATDAPSTQDTVTVTSNLRNMGSQDITSSVVTYLAWWDANGDGVFGMGDSYVDETGTEVAWTDSPSLYTTSLAGINVSATSTYAVTPVEIGASAFANSGTYNLTEIWSTSGGQEIDRSTTTFYVGGIDRALTFYEDAGRTTEESLFLLGQTNYTRVTGLTPMSQVQFLFTRSDGTTYTSAFITVDASGTAVGLYPITMSDPVGEWTCAVVHDGQVVIEEPFYVTYDASALHVTATDTPSQVETSTIAATLTNRGSVDITDSAVAYLVWWDTDEDGVFGPGDYYVDTDGLEKPYSEGDSMVTATTYGVDVSATSTYTPPPVLVSNAGMTQTGYYMVTATWATVDGWTIDTSETTFYSSTTTRALLTYEDPDRTIESTSFPVGASNYTKATGLTPGSSVVFVFVRSDDTTYGVTATVDYDGTAIATYTIDPDDPIGAWRVDLFRAGEVIASTPFLVVYDAFIIELHVTDAASQGDEAAITTRLSNRGIVDIMDSEVEYLVWWDEDGDGFLSAGDSYLDQDGVEQVYSGTGAVYSVLLTGIDVSAGTTVTPGTVLIPGDSLSHTGIHRVSEVWRTSSGVTIDTAEATFYVGHMTRNITLYRDADRLYEETTYTIPGSVYPEVTGLTPGAAVTFVFNRSDGTTYSVPATVAPDGSAIATYTLLPDDPTGWWTCEVVSASGDLLAEAPFYVTYSGEITALFATDAPNHDETVSVEATVTNTGPVAITDSSITYVIWWDSDGDGLFGMGDIYIDEHGDPYPWDGASAVHTHITTGVSVNAGASWGDATWAVSNHSFPEAGTWRLTATWTTSYGALIDQKTTTFDAIPALGWILFGFVVVGAAMAFGRRLKTPDGVTISGRPQWL